MSMEELILQIVDEEIDALLERHRIGIDYQTFSHHGIISLRSRIKKRIREEVYEQEERPAKKSREPCQEDEGGAES